MAVIKSDNDDRKYMHLQLENNLQILLISDPLTEKASAALDVKVGYFNDPEDLPGLAHFCEHLLFMGTETYPEENNYSQFLSAHGGQSNAFTSGEHTNFFFDVLAEFLEPALDRFSKFFLEPLFRSDCIERELLAIDSEHKKNILSDLWALYQLLKDSSDSNHPFHKFGTGNLHTLKASPTEKGIDIRNQLLEFHSKYYSANRMKLVVLGKEPLDKLHEMVVSKFQGVINKSLPNSKYGLPMKNGSENTLLRIKPVKDLKNLYLIFQALTNESDYLFHPFNYISHLIGHESEGSILSFLKKKGLANGITAGSPGFGGSGFDLFQIKVELTGLGLEKYEEVVLIVFQYIRMVKETGVQEWIYDEICKVNQIFFRFKEKGSPSSYTSTLAGNMHIYQPEHTLCGAYMMEKYCPELIKKYLEWLVPENTVILLQANGPFWTDTSKKIQKLNWYDTVYSEDSISQAFLKALQTVECVSELHLPNENKFIPESFETLCSKSSDKAIPRKSPSLALDNEFIRLWHKQDDRFSVPKGNIGLEIKSSIAYQSPENCVFTNIFASLLKEALNEYSYYAEIAGLDFSLENSTTGMVLVVSGYSDKLPILLQEILRKMTSFSIEQDQFKRILVKLIQKTKNWFQDAPHTHAIYYVTYFTQERLFTPEEKLEALNRITVEQVVEFSKRLIETCFFEGLVHGNFSMEDAIKIGNMVCSILKPASPIRPRNLQTIVLPECSNYIVQLPVFNPVNVNSAVEYIVQLGSVSDQTIRCLAALITHLAKERAFNTLRTQEQLGYIVHARARYQSEMVSFSIIVQSEHSPMYIETRIESFLLSFNTYLQSMTEIDFKKYQDSLKKTYLEELKNLNQEFNRIWSHIQSSYYNFDQNELDAAKVDEVTLDQVISFYKTKCHPSAKSRRKVSSHLLSQKCQRTYEEIHESAMELVLANSITLSDLAEIRDLKKTGTLAGFPKIDISKFYK